MYLAKCHVASKIKNTLKHVRSNMKMQKIKQTTQKHQDVFLKRKT